MARNGKIRRAPGFADRAGRDFERLDSALRTSREVLYARGYLPIETPLIEQTELFLRRSGGLLSSQMFDFTAPDGSDISLRPELTAPVIRHVLEQDGQPLPLRYQYALPIFRYTERPYDAPPNSVPSKRQYIQAGAELIGASQPEADGEIVATAYEMAKRLGVMDVTIRIGHVGLIWEILERFNLSGRAKLFLANQVAALANCDDGGASVEAEAIRLGLMPSKGQQSVETQASAAELLTRLASGSVQLPSATEQTSRTAEDVVAGLRRKLEIDVSNGDFPKAMDLMREIAQLRSRSIEPAQKPVVEHSGASCGTIDVRHDDLIGYAQSLADNYGLGHLKSLGSLLRVERAVESGGVHNYDVSVDLGLATSMAYYSGMIFEVCAYVEGELVSIGGGGRYDGLASSLGSDAELPALGFALNLDTILDLADGSFGGEMHREYIVLAPSDEHAAENLLQAASDLRADGHSVVTLFDTDVDPQTVARSLGDAEVVKVTYNDDEQSYGLVSE